MEPQVPHPSGARETRLLIATIAVSVLMLAVLARFRFPAHGAVETAEPAPAPLERMATSATYDELASTMADLDRLVRPSLSSLSTVPAGASVAAVRISRDRAVVWLPPGEGLAADADGDAPRVIGRDAASGIAIVSLPQDDSSVATPRAGAPRAGPRYVAVVDALPRAVSLRPAYVGTTAAVTENVTGRSLLSIAAAPGAMATGSPVFTFAGTFIGVVTRVDGIVTVVPADVLIAMAENLPQPAGIDLGIDVQALTEPLSRVAGATAGVMVAAVGPRSPAHGLLAAGDVIESLDGKNISTPAEFELFEQTRTEGSAVEARIVRRGSRLAVAIPATRPDADASGTSNEEPGLTVRTSGGRATVVAVRDGSAASRSGIERGDVIVGDDRGVRDVTRAFRELPDGGGMLVTIERDGARRIVALEKR